MVVTGLPNYGFGRVLPGYRKIHYQEIHGVKIHRVPLKPRKKSRLSLVANYLSFWKNSKRFLKHFDEDFDLVYSISMSPIIGVEGAGIFAARHHIPHVLHCLDLWPESAVAAGNIKPGSLAYQWLYGWSRRIYGSADKILLSSPSFAAYFHDVLKLDTEMVYVPQPPLVAPVPKNLPTYVEKTNLVYSGNIGNLQLIEQFVEATRLLPPDVSFRLHLIGSGSRLKAVLNRIDKEHLQKTVSYHGVLSPEECAAYFVNASALIVSLAETPSPVSKTVPIKLISSLSYGRPILAAIGGDGRQVLRDAGGTIFTNPDPQSIAAAYKTIMGMDGNSLKRLGDANAAFFRDHFDFSKVMDGLEAELTATKKR